MSTNIIAARFEVEKRLRYTPAYLARLRRELGADVCDMLDMQASILIMSKRQRPIYLAASGLSPALHVLSNHSTPTDPETYKSPNRASDYTTIPEGANYAS